MRLVLFASVAASRFFVPLAPAPAVHLEQRSVCMCVCVFGDTLFQTMDSKVCVCVCVKNAFWVPSFSRALSFFRFS